jgi:hypothetical protein
MRKSVLIPIATAVLAASGAAAGQEPPAAGCQAREQARSCDLDEILRDNRTFRAVTQYWGEPRIDGPAAEMKMYYFPSGERLWLSFTAGGGLARALLLSSDVVPKVRVVMNELAITRARRLDQLDLARPLTAQDVAAVWGPPDNLVGSGVDHWVYGLANGETITLVFDGDRLVGAGAPGSSPRPHRGGGDWMRFNNSYAYVLGDRREDRDNKPQPGERGGRSFLADPRSRDPATGRFRIDIPALQEAIARDGQATFLGPTVEDANRRPDDSYVVALVVDNAGPVQDYHWYMLNADGAWSGKGFRATNQDAEGNLILNPVTAAADFGAVGADRLDYGTFVGYFAVRRGARAGR